MLELMGREHGLERREALALASVVVDLRVTQLVNGVRGVHARLATTRSAGRQSDEMSTVGRPGRRGRALRVDVRALLPQPGCAGRLGAAAIVLFVVALVAWVAAFVGDRDRVPRCEQLRDVRVRLLGDSLRVRRRIPRAAAAHRARSARRARHPRQSLARTARRCTRQSRMMPSSFKLPDLGEGLTEGEVARWLVAEGQAIAEDDPLVEIQTDKATVEIPSPVRRNRAADPRRRGRDRPGRHGARRHRRAGEPTPQVTT